MKGVYIEYTLDTVMDIAEVFCLFIKIKDSFRIMKLNFAPFVFFWHCKSRVWPVSALGGPVRKG